MPVGEMEENYERIASCQDLPALFLSKMREFTNKTFLIDGLNDVKRTFGQVHDDAILYAKALKSRGVKEGSYVAILSDTAIEAYVFKIAVWLAGGCVSPLNTHLLPGDICQILEISTANILYCSGNKLELYEKIKSGIKKPLDIITDKKHSLYTSLQSWREELSLSPDEIYGFSTQPHDPHEHIVYLLFTSGTTGIPKGVQLSSMATLLNGCRIYSQCGPTFNTSPLYWISNPMAFVNTLLEGSELIFPGVKILPDSNKEDPYHILKCIEKYKPQKWMPSITVAVELCYVQDVREYDLSSLTHVSSGGSVLLPSKKKFICDNLFNGRNILQERFGSTEVGFLTSQWSFSPPDFDSPKAASFGPPSPGVQLKIVNVDTREELGPNEVGEILARSNCTMKGYINNELPADNTIDGWYALGDLCYYDAEGWFYYKARIKELIKYRGHQLLPGDLENVIISHPAVQEVCVVGRPHPIDCERPTAFVVKTSNSSVTEEELKDYVAERVNDSEKLRGGVIFKKSLPKSGVGKILRRNLRDELEGISS